jgi:hypothetical protein
LEKGRSQSRALELEKLTYGHLGQLIRLCEVVAMENYACNYDFEKIPSQDSALLTA